MGDGLGGLLGADLAQALANLRISDAAPGPELADAHAFHGMVEIQAAAPGTSVQHAGDGDRSPQVRGAGQENQRLALIEIGQVGGGELGVAAVGDHPQVGQDRAGQAIQQRRHAGDDLAGVADVSVGPAPDLGHAVHQEGVGRAADADHEDAAAPPVRAERGEHLVFIADRAVGQEDHLAHAPGVFGRVVHQGGSQRRQHLGAAAGLELIGVTQGQGDLFGRRQDGFVEQLGHAVVKANDVEAVGR
ncbi:hypothetical protein D3C87_1419270 [compost metagenome]